MLIYGERILIISDNPIYFYMHMLYYIDQTIQITHKTYLAVCIVYYVRIQNESFSVLSQLNESFYSHF